VDLHGDKTFALKSQKYRVSEALKTGEATVLFGACAPVFDSLESKRLLFKYFIHLVILHIVTPTSINLADITH
jgi:hypothetical protein